MVRKKDHFWEYAEELNGRFKYKFCDKDFPGGIARVKSHLSEITGRDIAVCSSVPEDVQAQAVVAIGGSHKRQRGDPSSGNTDCSVIGSTSVSHRQQTIPEMCAKKDKASVDKKLTRLFIMNNLSFNVVQTKSFRDFVKAVDGFGGGYVIPSYSTLRAKLIPDEKKDVEEYVRKVRKSWDATGCTIMSDIWTDLKERSFINIIAYFPGGAVFLNSFECSKEKKTGGYLFDIISSVIDNIGPQHVVQFISDNASNYDVAGSMLLGRWPHMCKTTCAAHGMQLLLKDIATEVEWVSNIFNEGKMIVNYMRRHTIVLSLMREFTDNKELRSPCKTRLTSNFLMLQSIVEVENGLRLFVASTEWRSMEYGKSPMALKVTEIIQRGAFWKETIEVIQALEPLVRVLRLADGDGSTFGYLYDAMERARNNLQQRCDVNKDKYKKILNLFDNRKKKNIIYKIHAVAALLNPSYFYSDNFKEDDNMREGMNYVLEKMVLPEERMDFVTNMNLYRAKSSKLFTTYAMMMIENTHPRMWWDLNGGVTPVLQKYAIRLLSQPCSSSTCERNWRAWEAAQTKKRNKLAPKMLEDLVYMRMNTMMMEKFYETEAKDLEPIKLDKIDPLPEEVDEESDVNEDEDEDGDENENLAWLDSGIDSSNYFDLQTCL